MTAARYFTAEVCRHERGQVGLRRAGDGRDGPFADRGCLYVISPEDARALALELNAAADAAESTEVERDE